MKKLLLLTILILMLSVLAHSDVITFQQRHEVRPYHVSGEIWMFNHHYNYWQPAPPYQKLQLKLIAHSGSGAYDIFAYHTTEYVGGFAYNFTIPAPYTINDYAQVRVTFRGSFYYGDIINGSAVIDIWWIQAY